MSEGEFFSSGEAEKAKVMDVIQSGQGLKARLVALNCEFKERAASWVRLSEANASDLGETTFKAGDDAVDILRPYPSGYNAPRNRPELNTVASLPRKHFDGDELWRLLSDREKTKRELASIKRQLVELGISI